MAFYVGQKVVCIDNNRDGGYGDEIVPDVGPVYTVRELFSCNGHDWLRLREIKNSPRYYTPGGVTEAFFHISRFRPVVERKTSIAIFTAMLNPSTEKVTA